jgi:hypothetical protein
MIMRQFINVINQRYLNCFLMESNKGFQRKRRELDKGVPSPAIYSCARGEVAGAEAGIALIVSKCRKFVN